MNTFHMTITYVLDITKVSEEKCEAGGKQVDIKVRDSNEDKSTTQHKRVEGDR